MRELAIGDIHGCARSFATLLEVIDAQRTDTIILLGDYIDRGSDSRQVIDLILNLSRKCTVVALSGNHEKMLLQARSEHRMLAEWLKHGGCATMESYGHEKDQEWELESIPERHWTFLQEQTLDYWETDKHIFVHASISPELDLDEQPDFLLFWQPFAKPIVHKSGKQMVCGHTSQKSGLPAVFDKGICIDTHACGGGWLTCFDTFEQKFIQTNELGQKRVFDLQLLIGLSDKT